MHITSEDPDGQPAFLDTEMAPSHPAERVIISSRITVSLGLGPFNARLHGEPAACSTLSLYTVYHVYNILFNINHNFVSIKIGMITINDYKYVYKFVNTVFL